MELTDRDKWIEAVKETSAAYAQENGELGQKIRVEQIDLIHRDVETAARHLTIARAETNTAFYSLGFSGHNNKDNR